MTLEPFAVVLTAVLLASVFVAWWLTDEDLDEDDDQRPTQPE